MAGRQTNSVYFLKSTFIKIVPRSSPFYSRESFDVLYSQIANVFIQDGSTHAQNLVLQNYRVEPLVPFVTPVTPTAANLDLLRRFISKHCKIAWLPPVT
jgi:hypothetical protein